MLDERDRTMMDLSGRVGYYQAEVEQLVTGSLCGGGCAFLSQSVGWLYADRRREGAVLWEYKVLWTWTEAGTLKALDTAAEIEDLDARKPLHELIAELSAQKFEVVSVVPLGTSREEVDPETVLIYTLKRPKDGLAAFG